ncbi:MAG: hypothetical protein ACREYF_22050 [Gammaproteobacteria bacterium]
MKTAVLASAAGAVSGALPLPARALTATGFGPSLRIAIVGGGIAGLNAASETNNPGAVIELVSINCGLSVTEFYAKVRFDPVIPP